MSTEKITMQQQFEGWARSQCMQLKKDGVVTTYAYERTDLAWNSWMASRAAIEVELRNAYMKGWEASGEGYNHEHPGMTHETERWQRDRDEALGIKP